MMTAASQDGRPDGEGVLRTGRPTPTTTGCCCGATPAEKVPRKFSPSTVNGFSAVKAPPRSSYLTVHPASTAALRISASTESTSLSSRTSRTRRTLA